jgi:hypothetical protein
LSILFAASLLAATPPDSPFERFFLGTTQGNGHVSVVVAGRHAMRDRSRGRKEAGALLIDQTVEEEGKPARHRAWRLVWAGADRVTGTISDANGPVAGKLVGNRLQLRYRMKDGPSVEQWIELHPDGRSATNRMSFHRFGFKVASVESEIRKID